MADYLDAIKSYAGDYTPPTKGYTNLYSPFQTTNPGVPGLGQPYYDPFKIQGAGSLVSPHLEAQICEEGYVLDSETNTCVPEDVVVEAIKSGDKDPSAFKIPDGKGGYISLKDMFDGGGPGRAGLFFEGSPVSGLLNKLGIKPHGYKDLVSQYRAGSSADLNTTIDGLMRQGMDYRTALAVATGSGNEDVSNIDRANIVGSLVGSDVQVTGNTSVDALAQIAAGNAKNNSNNDDGPSHAEIIAAHKAIGEQIKAEKDLIDANKAYDEKTGGGSGGFTVGNTGGSVPGGLVHYRQDGGVLPGAKPTIPDQMAMEEQAMMEQAAMAQPPMDPAMAGGMPPMQPPQPPMAPPRLSFAEKVAQAREAIRGGQTAVPTTSATPAAPMAMDGQGDGPVEILGGAGELQPSMVGPDMGVDDVDAMLEEGSFVMNPEAVEMYGDEIRAMAAGGVVGYNGGGVIGAAQGASSAIQQASQAINQAGQAIGGGGGGIGSPISTGPGGGLGGGFMPVSNLVGGPPKYGGGGFNPIQTYPRIATGGIS